MYFAVVIKPMNNHPWINYHHLLYFKTIAEEESVSRAAEKLRLGQPTLSAQLKQFEDHLGLTLFERQKKKLILTDQGRVALEYARNIFKLGSEMYEVLHDRIVLTRTHLQIGALDSISKQILLELTKASFKIGPCQVSVIEGKSDELLRELSAHRVDLLLTNFLPTSSSAKGLVHRSLVKKPISIYGTNKYKHLKNRFPESLNNQQFIMPTYDSKLRYDIDHWSKANGIVFDVIAESQDISLKKLMAMDGMGLIVAARHTVNKEVLNGELIEIGKLNNINEELFLVSAQRKISNPFAAQLMKSFSL
jgi:LysR family transcriptional regulator, transcriptional activator of nhaA